MENNSGQKKAQKVLLVILIVAVLFAAASTLYKKIVSPETETAQERGFQVFSESGNRFEFEYDASVWEVIKDDGAELLLGVIRSGESDNDLSDRGPVSPEIKISVTKMSELIKSTSTDEWLKANGVTSSSELLMSYEEKSVGSYQFNRVIKKSDAGELEILSYYLFAEPYVVELSIEPYEQGNPYSQHFEEVIIPNFKLNSLDVVSSVSNNSSSSEER